MATAGGAPPTGASPNPKREITPEQKRMFAGLGVVGVLALIVGVMYLPGLLSGGSTAVPTAPPPTTGANTAAEVPGAGGPVAVDAPGTGASGAGGAGAGALTGTTPGTAGAGGAAQPVVFIARSRTDPFQPVYLIPPPAPTPLPPPPPDPDINVPAPPGFENGINLPSIKDPATRAAVAAPLNIGVPSIPRLENTTSPRDAFPLPRTSSGDGGAGGTPQQSYDKRLAGVIIGDGVRALIELPSGEQRVVQPGDEVEGIRVLNIERFRQGDRPITRMLIRDTDGSQKYVELKNSPVAQTGGLGGEGGLGGPSSLR